MIVRAAAALLAVAALAACAGGTRELSVPASIRAAALRFAAENGEPSPTGGLVVATTRRAASRALWGVGADTDQDVWLVVLKGRFTYYGGPPSTEPSSEAPAVTAVVLVMLFDAADGRMWDWGLMNEAPDLARLGETHPLG